MEADLAVAAMIRELSGPPEPTDAQIRLMLARADAWRDCPVSRDRLLIVTAATMRHFESRFAGSWAQPYLRDRLGVDLAGDGNFHPGYAPDGWTSLVQYLRAEGVTDEEMITSGLATTARNGRLIDRFRDRLIFPIIHDGEILGFVGRRHPDLTDADQRGPKYLNTPDTPLFHKGDQLFGT